MEILVSEKSNVIKVLEERIADGYSLVTYNAHLGHAKASDLLFFRDAAQFDKFCEKAHNERSLYFDWSSKLVLDCLKNLKHDQNLEPINYSWNENFSVIRLYVPKNEEIVKNPDGVRDALKAGGFGEFVNDRVEQQPAINEMISGIQKDKQDAGERPEIKNKGDNLLEKKRHSKGKGLGL